MSIAYWINVSLHVLSALVWLGGMLFLGLVGAPVLRAIEPAAIRQELFQQLGIRFRRVGWWAIGVLVVTGTINLYFRGLLVWRSGLGDIGFWSTSMGQALAWKLIAATLMILNSAVHDFIVGPAAGRAQPGSERAQTLRRRAAMLGRVNALIGVVLVVAAVRVARGG